MTAGESPWLPPWQAAQRDLLLGWPALARGLWEALQGAPAAPPPGDLGMASPAAWPALGPTREDQEAWERLLQRFARLSAAQAQLATAWGAVLQRSLATLGEQLRQRGAAGRPVETLRALYDLWIDAAESAYAETAAASPYVELQAEFANASSELRICQRELLERWARQYDLPTRSELDAVHRRIRALERALRARKPARAAKPAARTVKPAIRAKAARTSRAPARPRGGSR